MTRREAIAEARATSITKRDSSAAPDAPSVALDVERLREFLNDHQAYSGGHPEADYCSCDGWSNMEPHKGSWADHATNAILARLSNPSAIRTDAPVIHVGCEDPEDHCGRCGGPNPSWHAASPLWNAVMRPYPEPYSGIVCPNCFAALAAEKGVTDHICLTTHNAEVPLATVFGDGRVWDPDQCMWVEPRSEEIRTDAGEP